MLMRFLTWLRDTFKKLDRKIQIAVVSALVVFCCIIPYISGSRAPTSEGDESPTQTPITYVETVMADIIPTIEPTATLTEAPTPTIEPSLTATELLPLVLETICLPQETQRETARVTRVIDGDTIEVDIEGASYRVRYIGMDTPENTSQIEYFGQEATQRNSDLVLGKDVIMIKDVSETDQYDRLLRYVLVGDTFVNYALVAEGYASSATYPPDVACEETFREAEREARDGGIGFWGQPPTALPPTASPATLPPPPAPTSPPVAPTQPPPATNCDPSYPTVCIPPKPPDLNCPDISFRRFTVLPPDPHGFDRDNNGIGCES